MLGSHIHGWLIGLIWSACDFGEIAFDVALYVINH
jgi:hypothetical protein